MGLLAFRALARQQGQHAGPAREQAAGPAGLADAVTKAVQGPHQIRHFPALGLQQQLHQQLAAAIALPHQRQKIHHQGMHPSSFCAIQSA